MKNLIHNSIQHQNTVSNDLCVGGINPSNGLGRLMDQANKPSYQWSFIDTELGVKQGDEDLV